MVELQRDSTGAGTRRGQGSVEKRPQALRGNRSGGESQAERGERIKRARKIDMFAKILGVVFAVSVGLSVASIGSSPAAKNEPPPRLIPGLGEVHHPVSTKNKEAQQFFDQGFKLVYGFNHDEARRSFQRAAELDSKLAMAHWGVALTLGPNYNLPVDPERERAGYDAVQRAIALKENASEPERAYIDALVVRYSNDPNVDLHALDHAYSDAMRKLAARYPDDLDGATLFAESMMNLNPWKLWTADGKAAEGTDEIVSVLESVLKRDPNHLGANHYYIHAVEASTHPRGPSPAPKGWETFCRPLVTGFTCPAIFTRALAIIRPRRIAMSLRLPRQKNSSEQRRSKA